MKIIRIRIKDFLGISQFKADCGKLNHIKGGNGVGKTSIVKAIIEAFKVRGHDPDVIRVGADKSEIHIELSDGLSVERVITPTGNRPKVVKDGRPVSKPAAYLGNLVGPFSFNPVEFFLAKPAERRTLILSSIPFTVNADSLYETLATEGVPIPMDLSTFDYEQHGLQVLENVQKGVFEMRAEVNRDKTQLAKAIEQDKADIPDTFDAEKYRDYDVTTTVAKMQDARDKEAAHDRDFQRLEQLRKDKDGAVASIELHEQRIRELEAEIESTKKLISEGKQRVVDIVAEGKTLRATIDAYEPPPIAELSDELKNYKHFEEIAQRLKDIDRREQRLEETTDHHDELNTLYKALTTKIPRLMLAQLKLPVDNLEIKGDNIFVDGKAIDKLSTSEQMEFALSVAKALAGDLRVVCIDRYESLDDDAKAKFQALADGDGFEYFVTEVTSGELVMEVKQ